MPTIRELFYNYRNARRNDVKPETLISYNATLNRCVPDWFDRDAGDITTDMLRERFEELCRRNGPRGAGLSQASTCMRVLKAIYNFGIRHHALTYNPVRHIPCYLRSWSGSWDDAKIESPVPQRIEPKAPRTSLTDEQLRKVCSAMREQPNVLLRDFMLFLLYTGLRRSDCAPMRWEDIDFEEGTIDLFQSKIPVGKRVLAILQERKRENRGSSPYVFYAEAGRSISVYEKRQRRIALRARVDFSFGTLRTTFFRFAGECLEPQQVRMLEERRTGSVDLEQLRVITQRVETKIATTAEKQRVRLELAHVQKACAAQ